MGVWVIGVFCRLGEKLSDFVVHALELEAHFCGVHEVVHFVGVASQLVEIVADATHDGQEVVYTLLDVGRDHVAVVEFGQGETFDVGGEAGVAVSGGTFGQAVYFFSGESGADAFVTALFEFGAELTHVGFLVFGVRWVLGICGHIIGRFWVCGCFLWVILGLIIAHILSSMLFSATRGLARGCAPFAFWGCREGA